jgi:hypothetical protein
MSAKNYANETSKFLVHKFCNKTKKLIQRVAEYFFLYYKTSKTRQIFFQVFRICDPFFFSKNVTTSMYYSN